MLVLLFSLMAIAIFAQARKEKLMEIRGTADSTLRIYVCQQPKGDSSFSWERL
jgi:hypothetical protein